MTRTFGAEVSRETGLLWLHDHIGREVAVQVVHEIGDSGQPLLFAYGELRHHDVPRSDGDADERDEWMGVYHVGDAHLSIPERAAFFLDSDELHVVLADDQAALPSYAVS